jgi:hypothetical protein
MYVADGSVCLLADSFRNEVVAIHAGSGRGTFLVPAEDVPIYLSKLFYRDVCNLHTNIFFQSFRSGDTVVNFVLQTTPEDSITRNETG